MRVATKENIKLTLVALAIIVVVFPVGLALELRGVNFDKWFALAWWTAFVFGLLLYGYGQELRAARPMAIFLSSLGVHLCVMISYLRSVPRFPDLFFLFFSPVEAVLIVGAITLLTDADYSARVRRLRRRGRVRSQGGRAAREPVRKHGGPE